MATRRPDCGEKLCADRGRFEHENFLNAGDGCVGPDIGPGFGLVARGEDFDQQDGVSESAFLGVIAGTGDRKVWDADVRLRLNAGDHAGSGDDAARAASILEMASDQVTELGLYCAMGAVGRGHRLRLAVDELPELWRGRVPGEEFRDGHPDRDFG